MTSKSVTASSKPVHEWQKQILQVQEYKNKQVQNIFDYDDFAYEEHEWDNIPPVVPRFAMHLEKYIEGVTQFCNEIN